MRVPHTSPLCESVDEGSRYTRLILNINSLRYASRFVKALTTTPHQQYMPNPPLAQDLNTLIIDSPSPVFAPSAFANLARRCPDVKTTAVETQATVSTANTGSLTPQEGSSSAEGGRAAGEGGIRAPPPVEPLTKASAECCSPQASLRVRRLSRTGLLCVWLAVDADAPG